MKKIAKITIQIIFFLLCTLLATRALWEWTPGFFVALSPVVHIGNVRSIITGDASYFFIFLALPLVLLGFLFKRVFCFYACPLGFFQDLLPSLKKKITFIKNRNTSQAIVFTTLFLISLFSINVLAAFDPLVIYARMVNIIEKRIVSYGVIFGILFTLILILSFVSKRAWCFYLCPLGSFFDGCSSLKQWAKDKTDTFSEPIDKKRRSILISVAGGFIAGLGIKKAYSDYADKTLIRPPGAKKESVFKEICIRCGNCINACITNGLQPTFFESGWDGLYTPRLVPRIGECDEYCNRCGWACPTGAITPLDLSVKRNKQLGIAHLEKKKCLAWEHGQLCFICGEFCPYLALDRHMKENRIPCPIVKEDICRGCGLCEKECPTHAIRVYRKNY